MLSTVVLEKSIEYSAPIGTSRNHLHHDASSFALIDRHPSHTAVAVDKPSSVHQLY